MCVLWLLVPECLDNVGNQCIVTTIVLVLQYQSSWLFYIDIDISEKLPLADPIISTPLMYTVSNLRKFVYNVQNLFAH